jgi:probable rRNA maturation factor
MPDILNNQRKIPVDRRSLTVFVARLDPIADSRDFTIAFVSDRRMRELNTQFRGKDSTTDVLSFPYEADKFELEHGAESADDTNFLGDIVISAEQADRQAAENGLTLENEIKQLILHGLLHLCGYDHETDNGEMNARELELRDMLGI